MTASRALITGAAGLIGRAVATRLRDEGAEIVGLDPRGDPHDTGRLSTAQRLPDWRAITSLGARFAQLVADFGAAAAPSARSARG